SYLARLMAGVRRRRFDDRRIRPRDYKLRDSLAWRGRTTTGMVDDYVDARSARRTAVREPINPYPARGRARIA
ncbi:MAG: hypothetical protein ACREX3_10195, partial [Gammaproteobacteria bacterium]